MEAILIKFTKEELSQLNNFKKRIQNTLDDYPDKKDCDFEQLYNFKDSFETISKNFIKILDYITLSKIITDVDSKENIKDGYNIITKYFSSLEYANLYYLKLCNQYKEVKWDRIPSSQESGIYKYKVK